MPADNHGIPSAAEDIGGARVSQQARELVEQGAANIKRIQRKAAFGRHVHWAKLFALWLVMSAAAIIATCWLWHILTPERWHFMTAENVTFIQNIIFGGIVGGLVNQLIQRIIND